MNYPEYVLRRSEALWKELEEAWQRGLATAAGVMRGSGADAEGAEDRNAVKRLAEKIFPAESAVAGNMVQALATQERETRGLAEVPDTNGIREGNGDARWLADELRRGTTEGVAPERVQERTVDFAPAYETADLQTLSQSVERDARRYDGGFLLY